jgi:hypothetical protein
VTGQGRLPHDAPAGGNPKARVALVLGLVATVLWPAGPFAWWLGVAGRRRVERGITSERYCSAVAGQTLGIAASIALALYALFVLMVVLAE